jgi:hypothetical protein
LSNSIGQYAIRSKVNWLNINQLTCPLVKKSEPVMLPLIEKIRAKLGERMLLIDFQTRRLTKCYVWHFNF